MPVNSFQYSPSISNRADMSSRIGLEAEAINRLTDGVQSPAIRAILVQCLAGEIAPSLAIPQMLATSDPSEIRAAIDDVTHLAATISRAGDRLVRDRVDELTQVFIEQVAGLADVSEPTKNARGPDPGARDLPFWISRSQRSPSI